MKTCLRQAFTRQDPPSLSIFNSPKRPLLAHEQAALTPGEGVKLSTTQVVKIRRSHTRPSRRPCHVFS
ncbi:hypothetical protein RRG08_051685 [Elysia crispata]|uniref:Uncharacterized protein n=1 Tax=Elysia crispata TaxID=231223 RepID=A0AAE1DZ41_9GAST|nr:hypothetical protein RRG08_051685 [Elysia crispata]